MVGTEGVAADISHINSSAQVLHLRGWLVQQEPKGVMQTDMLLSLHPKGCWDMVPMI